MSGETGKRTETTGDLRARAASLRWAAERMQDEDRVRELRELADRLEDRAAALDVVRGGRRQDD